jgi:pimeloyl-ACP methyl ester carboxylesterase
MDRRGHGQSQDAPAYRIEREYEDIARCIEACGPDPVDIVAHSYGALCAIGAARMGANINRLILYEPPIPAVADAYYSRDLIPAMQEALARGDRAEAFSLFLTGVLGLPQTVIAAMRRVSAWKGQTEMAPLVLRELREVDRFQLRADDYRSWTIPTLLLLGEDSPPQYHATADALQACLPGSAIEVLPGQRHAAMTAAPAQFAASVLRFLNAIS